jgi:hypothetical protein
MPKSGPYGSVRGVRSNVRPYRDAMLRRVFTAMSAAIAFDAADHHLEVPLLRCCSRWLVSTGTRKLLAEAWDKISASVAAPLSELVPIGV